MTGVLLPPTNNNNIERCLITFVILSLTYIVYLKTASDSKKPPH